MSYDSMSLLSGDLNLSISVKHELTYLNTVIGRIVNVLMKLNFVVKKLFFPIRPIVILILCLMHKLIQKNRV